MKYIFLFLALILVSPFTALGQFDGGIIPSGATLELNPQNPAPDSPFSVTINDYSVPGQTSSIIWRVDGQVIVEAENSRRIDLTSKGSGEATVVEATLGRSGGGNIVIKQTVTPLYLDVIIEAQTRSPGFYTGRSLPSVGSTINATAILSSNLAPSDLVYLWEAGDKVIDGGPLRGRNRISATVPSGQVFLIKVEVRKTNGDFVASRLVQVRTFSPEIYFYEKSSLYGVNNKPISSFGLIGASATIVAEPYNLDIKTFNSPPLLVWEVDGKETSTTLGNPYEITLARPEGVASGASAINFHVRNLTNLLQGAKGSFRINF